MGKKGKSARELRREQDRKDRKALQEIVLTPTDRLTAAFYRNGITTDDVRRSYERGKKEGYDYACRWAYRTMYAAIIMVLVDDHGMSQDEAVDMLIEIDHKTVLCIDDQELIDEVYRKTGIEINWNDTFERVTRTEADECNSL